MKKLEKDTATWKSRFENCNRALLDMIEEVSGLFDAPLSPHNSLSGMQWTEYVKSKKYIYVEPKGHFFQVTLVIGSFKRKKRQTSQISQLLGLLDYVEIFIMSTANWTM